MESDTNPNKVFSDILTKLLRDKLDKFELLQIVEKFAISLGNEESFSKQKYILQKFALEQLLKDDTVYNSYYSRLLKETESHLSVSTSPGYLCCLVGCLFSSPRHRTYLQHLKSVHLNNERLVCNFRKKCKREYQTIGHLLDHVRDCHSLLSSAPRPQVQEDIACKCNLASCSGVKFRNVELLMTHLNVKHAQDERSCIFYGCSQRFSAGSISRNHFRLKHKKTNQMKLKPKHLVEPNAVPVVAEDGGNNEHEETLPDDDDDLEELYGHDDSSLLEVRQEINKSQLEEIDKKKFFKLQHADFLNRLSNFKFIPAKTVTQIADEYLETSRKSQSLREQKLRAALSCLPNLSEQQIEEVVGKTIHEDEYLQAQAELSTEFKRIKFISEHFKYIPPVGIILNKEEVKNGGKPDYVHYIPVIESFKSLMEDESLFSVLNQEREKTQDGNIINDLRDGIAFQDSAFFKSNPGAFAAHFYSDAVEVSNPLGWAKGRHKIVQVFYTISQIPRCQRSQIDRMMLCMVFKDSHIKKYGYKTIYKKLVDDLKVLEAGIKVDFPVEREVRMGLLAYSADNLEAHGLGGFNCCFSSFDICRFCHCQHGDLLDNIHDYDGDAMKKYWTEIEYDRIFDDLEKDIQEEEDTDDALVTEEDVFYEVEEDEYDREDREEQDEDEEESSEDEGLSKQDFGLKSRCPLNELQAFHAVLGFPPDCMHDWLEGVVAQDLNSGIKILVLKGWFSLEEYNRKLSELGYPSYESSDRRHEVRKKAKNLSGKACSLWVHIRNFPLIIKSLVMDEDDEVFQYLLQMVELTARITVQEFRSHEIDVLEDRVIQFLDARKLIFSSFPETLGTPKPKHHFITHYGNAI